MEMTAFKRLLPLMVGLVLLLSLTACSKKALSTTVDVVENEWTLKPSVASVKAGETTFVVKNGGTLGHDRQGSRSRLQPAARRRARAGRERQLFRASRLRRGTRHRRGGGAEIRGRGAGRRRP